MVVPREDIVTDETSPTEDTNSAAEEIAPAVEPALYVKCVL
jgi:hypothetical protein